MGRRHAALALLVAGASALAPPPRLRRLRRAPRADQIARRASGGDDDAAADERPGWLAAITGDEELAEDLRVYGKTLAVCLAIRFLIVEPRFIPSLSMYPGLDVGDQLAVEKVTKLARPRDAPYRRNEVVVFNPPQSFKDIVNSRARNEALIKRVVAGRAHVNFRAPPAVFVMVVHDVPRRSRSRATASRSGAASCTSTAGRRTRPSSTSSRRTRSTAWSSPRATSSSSATTGTSRSTATSGASCPRRTSSGGRSSSTGRPAASAPCRSPRARTRNYYLLRDGGGAARRGARVGAGRPGTLRREVPYV